jgi:hypothetical protein
MTVGGRTTAIVPELQKMVGHPGSVHPDAHPMCCEQGARRGAAEQEEPTKTTAAAGIKKEADVPSDTHTAKIKAEVETAPARRTGRPRSNHVEELATSPHSRRKRPAEDTPVAEAPKIQTGKRVQRVADASSAHPAVRRSPRKQSA